MSDRVSQKRIAEMLNLSTATVSRSLRNDRSIHPDTRARVLETASKLGYQLPGRGHREPDSAEAVSIQVLLGFPAISSRASEQILAGISNIATSRNVSIAVHVVSGENPHELLHPAQQPVGMRNGVVDAIVMLSSLPQDIVEALSHKLACVALVHHYPELRVDCVDTDQIVATRQLVDHLLGLGHRRIGFLGWNHELSWVRRRFQGYREGLFQAGLQFEQDLALNLDGAMESAQERAEAVLRLVDQGVTAWVCVADPVAFDLCRELRKRKIKPGGGKVSITGYDGIDSPPDCPALTTIRVPYRALGAAAVQRVLNRIEDPAAPMRDVLIRHELVIGDTTGRRR